MQDLYATTFECDEPIEGVAPHVAEWAMRGFGEPPDILATPRGNKSVDRHRDMRWASFRSGERRALELVLSHPDSAEHDVAWVSTVELASSSPGHTYFTVRLTREGQSARLAPAAVVLRRPAIVTNLLGLGTAKTGGIPLSGSATVLSADQVDTFVSEVLSSRDRTLPALLVSTPAGYTRPLVDPDVLADELAGLACVFLLQGHLAWRRVTDAVGPDSRVPPGGMRLYWPGWGETDLRHPWWTRSSLEDDDRITRNIFRMLARLSVIRTPRDPILRELKRHAADEARRELVSSASTELQELFDEQEHERTRLEGELETHVEALKTSEERIISLEEDLTAQRAQWAAVSSSSAQVAQSEGEEAPGNPETWADVAGLADELESDALKFTDAAKEMLSDNPYPFPSRMWWALNRFREAADAWRAQDGEIGQRLKEWVLTEFELEISLHDNKQLEFEFDGESYVSEEHVKLDDNKSPDKCGRIYFARDNDRKRFIVGHVGLHL